MIQLLIHGQGFLVPNYQAIFSLADINYKAVEKSRDLKSIEPLAKFLYGFESLARVNLEALESLQGLKKKDILT